MTLQHVYKHYKVQMKKAGAMITVRNEVFTGL